MDKLATTRVPLHPLLANRWSPRGFDRDHAVAPEQLAALIEAARWAPSANNTQPWRFLVANRGEAAFDELLAVLNPGNRQWAGAASALILVAADPVGPFALYDTGQAVASLVAQAGHEGLSAHQMGGFDKASAAERFALAEDQQPVVVIAIGRHDADAPLSEPFADRERAPRVRRPVDDLLLHQPVAA
jgi:nitroreductase